MPVQSSKIITFTMVATRHVCIYMFSQMHIYTGYSESTVTISNTIITNLFSTHFLHTDLVRNVQFDRKLCAKLSLIDQNSGVVKRFQLRIYTMCASVYMQCILLFFHVTAVYFFDVAVKTVQFIKAHRNCTFNCIYCIVLYTCINNKLMKIK